MYQRNCLSVSAQKLFASSLSHYLTSLCVHNQVHPNSDHHGGPMVASCKCSNDYLDNYLHYLMDARCKIDSCFRATLKWNNSYNICQRKLNQVLDEQIIFCSSISLSPDVSPKQKDGFVVEVLDLTNESTLSTMTPSSVSSINSGKLSHSGHKMMANLAFDVNSNRIQYDRNPSLTNDESSSLPINQFDSISTATSLVDWPPASQYVGKFIATIVGRLELFFTNDILTNLHLTGLVTRLCHFPHRLLLSLFFDETLVRTRGVPCLLHVVQKLCLQAQNHCDDIQQFETRFYSAKSNLHSVPIGELNCQFLTSSPHHQSTEKHKKTSQSKFDIKATFPGLFDLD